MPTINMPVSLPDDFVDEVAKAITEQVMKQVDKNIKVNDLPPYPTKKQVRDVLQVGYKRIDAWISEGLPIMDFGKETRFDREDIKTFLNKKKI